MSWEQETRSVEYEISYRSATISRFYDASCFWLLFLLFVSSPDTIRTAQRRYEGIEKRFSPPPTTCPTLLYIITHLEFGLFFNTWSINNTINDRRVLKRFHRNRLVALLFSKFRSQPDVLRTLTLLRYKTCVGFCYTWRHHLNLASHGHGRGRKGNERQKTFARNPPKGRYFQFPSTYRLRYCTCLM